MDQDYSGPKDYNSLHRSEPVFCGLSRGALTSWVPSYLGWASGVSPGGCYLGGLSDTYHYLNSTVFMQANNTKQFASCGLVVCVYAMETRVLYKQDLMLPDIPIPIFLWYEY